jgi:hypothetical protein
MIDFFDWFKATPGTGRTWVIMGKGPTFDRAGEIKNLDKQYATFALNHVCRQRHVFVAHMIDANVLDEIEDLEKKADFVVMPWQPHYAFKPTAKTLEDVVAEKPVLQDLEAKGRLLWYNLCTGSAPKPGSPVVAVHYFSAEAAVSILAMAGVKKIRTLGIDGGKKYSGAFKDIKPFRGGHTTFDLQTNNILQTVKKHGVNYAAFFT